MVEIFFLTSKYFAENISVIRSMFMSKQKRLGFRPLTNEKKITCLYLKEVKRITSQIPGPYLYFPLWRRCLNVASMINLSFMCQANFIIFNLDSFVFCGKSTTSQLLQVSNEIGKSLDQIIPTDILYLDFSKAFDKVDQGFWKPLKLVSKLPYRSSSESHHLWQDIAISPPPPPPVLSDVPQGSILGSLLFLMFVNDLPQHTTTSSAALLADDTI